MNESRRVAESQSLRGEIARSAHSATLRLCDSATRLRGGRAMNKALMTYLIWPVVKFIIAFIIVQVIVAAMNWVERRLLGLFQARLGPNRVGPWGLLQIIADPIKFLLKEDIVPAQRGEDRVLPRADPAAAAGVHRLLPDSVRTAADVHRHARECRAAADPRADVHRRVRNHPRRLGLEQQVLADGRPALGGADGVVRSAVRTLDRRRADDHRLARPRDHRPLPGSERLELHPADRGLLHLPRVDERGEQPHAVRSAGSGVGARGRLSHRVFGDEVRVLHARPSTR